jgi:cystathionine beta-lyase
MIVNPLEQYSLDELRNRTSEKWAEYPSDVLPLWVAEMDVKLPEELKSELLDAIVRGDVGYLSMEGFNRYTYALAYFAKRHWNWDTNPEIMFDVPDVVHGCVMAIDAFLEHNPENSVIVSTPIYPPFINKYPYSYHLIDAPLTSPYIDDNPAVPSSSPYRLDFEALENAFKEGTSNGKKAAYALCNPSNPTGTVHTPSELKQLSDLSDKYGVLIVSDEIHGPLVTKRNYEKETNECPGHTVHECSNPHNHGSHSAFTPYLSIPDVKLGVVITSASKAFSLPGMKAALVVPTPEVEPILKKSGQFGKASSEQIGAMAQTICYNKCDDWLYHLVQALRNNETYFRGLLEEYFPLAKWIPGEGTYFAWVDFTAYVENGLIPDGISPSAYFIEHAKVAFNAGSTFAVPQRLHWAGLENSNEAGKLTSQYDNFVRINLATSQVILREACERIGGVLGG